MMVPDVVLKIKDLQLTDHVDSVQAILNNGLYQTRVLTVVPTWSANEGESAISAIGTARDLYYHINSVWTRITFNSLGSMVLFDSDNDTGITPEFSSDEDVLRFYTAGIFNFAMGTYGFALASNLPVMFDGTVGDYNWVYDSATGYMQAYTNGNLRMEM